MKTAIDQFIDGMNSIIMKANATVFQSVMCNGGPKALTRTEFKKLLCWPKLSEEKAVQKMERKTIYCMEVFLKNCEGKISPIRCFYLVNISYLMRAW